MRLLQANPDGSFSLVTVVGSNIPEYAILSHTWDLENEEPTFQDLIEGLGERKVGFRKIRFCGEQANLDGFQYFWVDSCCIDKSSSAELTEAINSMFRWYRNAAKCYVYLSDVPTTDIDLLPFRQSRWFTRGWTLQELLAPRSVEFFSRDGRKLGDRQSLELQIHQATGIPVQALQQLGALSQFSVEERMSWAAQRETMIEEDQAYCLLGIFDVYLPLIYGEGREHAFRRLRKEIITRHSRDGPRSTYESIAAKTEACVSNLAATDQTLLLSQVLSRSKDACSWILKNQKYSFWCSSTSSSLLWITAKAGCGKTTLAAHICQMIPTYDMPEALAPQTKRTERVVLYFFFQKSNNDAVRTASGALRTVICQLFRQVPAVLPILMKRHDLLSAKGDFEWSWENLSSVLSEMLEQTSLASPVYIILDALDVCEVESRALLLDWIKSLVDENGSSTTSGSSKAILKILVTGRQDGDMIDHLAGYSTLEITDTDTLNDIKALIRGRMEEFAGRRRLKPDVVQRIIHFLEAEARGMFLWVDLIIKELERRDERLSDEVIASKLRSTPLTLIDTYESILHNAPPNRKQDMWRIIRWLLFGSRSLTLAELELALCLETGISTWHDIAGDLIFLCGSLIRLDGPQEEVSFVHQTARDFLEAFPQITNSGEVEALDMDMHAANEHLAAICVQYLQDVLPELEQLKLSRVATLSIYVEMMQSFLDSYPLLHYAIESWAFHARAASTPTSLISTMIRKLLSSQRRRDNIMTLTFFIYKPATWNIPVGQTRLHLAAYFDIPWLVHLYISEDISLVHATTGVNDTPLIWASEMGNKDCVKALLDAGADPNDFELDGWSALHWAARNGHVDVAMLLLERGAALSPRDRQGHTPLDWAIDRENWDVAGVIIHCSQGKELRTLDNPSQRLQLIEKTKRMYATRSTGRLWDMRP